MASERIEAALDAFVRSKQKGTDSGNYQRNARRAIEEWIDWLADREEPIENFDQLQVSQMRQYARYLEKTSRPRRTRRLDSEYLLELCRGLPRLVCLRRTSR
jgi:hypothetical protein